MISTQALTHVIVFTSGFAAGSIIGYRIGTGEISVSEAQFRRAVATAVTVTWALAVVADILVSTYTVPALLHGIMGAVAGYLFSDGGFDIQVGPGK